MCDNKCIKKDMLSDIFTKQIELNKRITPDLYEQILDASKMQEWALKFNLALQQEQAELVDCFPWKFWKKGDLNIQNARVEIVDMLHFLVSIATVLGMTADDIYRIYCKKSELNHTRQSGGYRIGKYKKVVNGVEDNDSIN